MASDVAEYSPQVHQTDLWQVSETAQEFRATLTFDDTDMHLALRLARHAGNIVNDEYLDDLKTVKQGLDHQFDFNRASDQAGELEGYVGWALLKDVRAAISSKVAERKSHINDTFARVGVLPIMINDTDTLQSDTTQVEAFWDSKDEGVGPVFPQDAFDHPGDRVAKLVECLDITDEWYYRFLIEGKSGQMYDFNPQATLPRIMVVGHLLVSGSSLSKTLVPNPTAT